MEETVSDGGRLNWSEWDRSGHRRDTRMQRRLVEQHRRRETVPTAAPAPGVGAIVAITALFGLFGLIPMFSAMDRARAGGHQTGGYVAAFVVTFAVMTAVAFVVLGVIG